MSNVIVVPAVSSVVTNAPNQAINQSVQKEKTMSRVSIVPSVVTNAPTKAINQSVEKENVMSKISRVVVENDLTEAVANQYVRVDGVVLDKPRLSTPVKDQFGSTKWVVKGTLDSEESANDLAAMGVKVYKDNESNTFFAYFERKTHTANGRPNRKLDVVGADLAEQDPRMVGSDSVANLRVYFHKYMFGGKTGVTAILTSLQVTKLVVADTTYHDAKTSFVVEPTVEV